MSINVVVISGNATRDPECKRTQSGMPIVSFGIAVNDRRKDPQTGEWRDYPNFIDVTAFGERWEKLAPYMPKGTKLTVHGKLRWSQWERDGQKRSKLEVIAEDVELPPKPRGQQGGYQQQGGAQYSQAEVYDQPHPGVYDEDIPF